MAPGQQVETRPAAIGGTVNVALQLRPQIQRQQMLQGVDGTRGDLLHIGLRQPDIVVGDHIAGRACLFADQPHVGSFHL